MSRHRSIRAGYVSEPLERRRLLANTTLITHGFGSDTSGWITALASQIARGEGGGATVIKVTATPPGTSDVSFSAQPITLAGVPTSTDNLIVLFDWSSMAGTISPSGWLDVQGTANIAVGLAHFLQYTAPNLWRSMFFSNPIQLIGHSRGGSLVLGLANELGKSGVVIQQVTTIDPHPVDGVREPGIPVPNPIIGLPPIIIYPDWGDYRSLVPANVVFADNYWRTAGDHSIDFTGEEVSGAANFMLNESVLDGTGYETILDGVNGHADAHLFYHGTADLRAAAFDGSYVVPPSWNGNPWTRSAVGFNLSRGAGSIGLPNLYGTNFGGTSTRYVDDLTAGEATYWPSLVSLSVNESDGVFSLGTTVPIDYRFTDPSAAATGFVDFFLDDDQNPFNNLGDPNVPWIGNSDPASSGAWPYSATASGNIVLPANTTSGLHYIVGRITNSAGKTRYLYLPKPIDVRNGTATVIDKLWTGEMNNDWSAPGNWLPTGVPGGNVFIPSGSVVAAGALSGVSKLILDGTLTMTAGTLSGTTTVSSGATLKIAPTSGTAANLATNSTLTNLGTIVQSGLLDLSANAVIDNRGTYEVTDQAMLQSTANPGTAFVRNGGTFRKTGTGYAYLISGNAGVQMQNTGTIDVAGGILRLDNGGSSSGGRFTFSNGGTLLLPNGFTFVGTNTGSGDGMMQMASGWFLAPDGQAATLNFGPDNLLVVGGAGIGSGLTNLGAMRIDVATGTAAYVSHDVTLTNLGTIVQSGLLDLSANAVIDNRGTYEVTDQAMLQSTANPGTAFVRNGGTFRKTGTGYAYLISGNAGVQMQNTGTIDVAGGILRLDNGLTTSASSKISLLATSAGQYAQLVVGGTTPLAGTLQILFAAGYQPSAGQSIDPITGSLTGTFSAIYASAGNGVEFKPSYLPDRVRLTAVTDVTPPVILSSTFEFETRQALHFQYSEAVGASLTKAAFFIRDVVTNASIPAAAMSLQYDASGNVAVLTFPGFAGGVLPDGRYRVTVAAEAFADGAGNVNTQSTTLDFFVLAGDADRNARVDFSDLLILAQSYNKAGRTFSQGNFDYSSDGKVEFGDLLLLAQRYGKVLAAAPALIAAPAMPAASKHRGKSDVLPV